MQLSILVISRTPSLLSAMLASLQQACSLPSRDVEVLCSWNGSQADEAAISNRSGYELLIAQRDPYHFAANMNGLVDKATGTHLLLINDDVVLDPGSLDAALRCLESHSKAGIVGARLRHGDGSLAHAGIVFDSRNIPTHTLEGLIAATSSWAMESDRPVPAVTGAVMLLRRSTFQQLRFQEAYNQCGEDVELCLDLRQQLNLEVWLCAQASGLHESESTRKQQERRDDVSADLARMRARYRRFLDNASAQQLQIDLASSQREAEALKELNQVSDLKTELSATKQLTAALQLNRLRLEQELEQLRAEQRQQCSERQQLEAMKRELDRLSHSWIPPRLRR
jgi:GT2 family glycosyltransferase